MLVTADRTGLQDSLAEGDKIIMETARCMRVRAGLPHDGWRASFVC